MVGTYFLEKKEQDASVDGEEKSKDEDDKSEDVEKKPQTRTGSLILFKVEGDEM